MFEAIHPVWPFLIGALLLPLLPRGVPRAALAVLAPVLGAALLWALPVGTVPGIPFLGQELTFLRVDRLAVIFALIFCVAGALAMVFAWELDDALQQSAALLYAGSAVGAVLAGDLVALFIFWEGTAIASVFLVWARGTETAYRVGMRYLIVQITSGVILLAGAALYLADTGSLAFEAMTLDTPATWLIFLAIGIKCSFPLLNMWLPDTYPAATVTGAVILSIFTTKLAVYALARGFPGADVLLWVGAAMAVLPIFHALIEDDLRRVLSYSLISQLGFMVVGVGIGTELSISGSAAHAVSGILYKSLLFMAVGAVLLRAGTARASDLGGLVRSMPVTAGLSLIGAASISAVPLFTGFVSKSLILGEAGHEGHAIVWAMLLAASAGAVLHTAIKVPFFAFFGADRGHRVAEAPRPMVVAMALTGGLCVLIGCFPGILYGLLPSEVDYKPYTVSHIITQLQLLTFAALAFAVLWRLGLFPRPKAGVTLDFDWVYRRVMPRVIDGLAVTMGASWDTGVRLVGRQYTLILRGLYRHHGPEGRIARTWPTGAMVLWVAVLLLAVMLVNFI
ncbi:MAG: Na(+)/H(+) antiporter subunit D [Pseudomonadota bacterium]